MYAFRQTDEINMLDMSDTRICTDTSENFCRLWVSGRKFNKRYRSGLDGRPTFCFENAHNAMPSYDRKCAHRVP